MQAVQGVLLHESVLLNESGDDLSTEAEKLLFRLQHSKLHIGIAFGGDLALKKDTLIRCVGDLYAKLLVKLDTFHPENTFKKVCRTWDVAPDACVFVSNYVDERVFVKISSDGWNIIIQDSSTTLSNKPGVIVIHKLHDLLVKLSHQNKQVFGASIITVGYVMKWSREKDFLKRGLFPILPTNNGLAFIPIDLNMEFRPQLEIVSLVLHKVTDEICIINNKKGSCSLEDIKFSEGMEQLERCIKDMSLFMIDPFQSIIPLLDRVAIQTLLHEVIEVNDALNCKIRTPHVLEVLGFDDPNLQEKLSQAQVSLPVIVKPQVACGVATAHKMAIVFTMDEFKGLSVPVPAVIQEYIDHSSIVYKFYVLGEEVFYAVRRSTPNAAALLGSARSESSSSILFDSLKSLPVDSSGILEETLETSKLDLHVVTATAMAMSRKLHLTIFGFDVVIQARTNDHVIVDVNYLPSFKEIQDDIAVPAFWRAIKSKYDSYKHEIG